LVLNSSSTKRNLQNPLKLTERTVGDRYVDWGRSFCRARSNAIHLGPRPHCCADSSNPFCLTAMFVHLQLYLVGSLVLWPYSDVWFINI